MGFALRGLIVAIGIGLAAVAAARAETTAHAVRLAGHGDTARIVIDIDAPVRFDAFALAGPDRLVVDLEGVVWRLAERAPTVHLGPVKGLRVGQFGPATARLVIDLAVPTTIRQTFALPPTGTSGHRLVLDIGPGGPALPTAPAAERQAETASFTDTIALALAVPLPTEAPRATTVAAVAAPMPRLKPTLARPIIVIDPGHGGDDPGAIARDGTYEKALTLAAARDLRDLLTGTGRYDVVLTRDSDVFLSLADRVEMARREGADLFVSLHCDALDDPAVRGATVYTVSETASDLESQMLAAKENQADLIGGIAFTAASYDEQTTTILIDLTRRDTMNASARFAEALGAEVGKVAKLRRNSHRFAGFKVLKAPDVPSVLFEMGYVSNAKDLAMLRDRGERKTMLRAMVRAVDRYFERVTAFQAP